MTTVFIAHSEVDEERRRRGDESFRDSRAGALMAVEIANGSSAVWLPASNGWRVNVAEEAVPDESALIGRGEWLNAAARFARSGIRDQGNSK